MSTTIEMRKVEELHPHRENLRARMGDVKGLAESIAAVGIQEPLVVRWAGPEGDGVYLQVVAGHRRLEAAKRAGLEEVPVIVRELTDSQAVEVMLVENLQREDLSPTEEALGLFTLVTVHDLTAKQLAERIGRSQRHVRERLKLMELPEPAFSMVDRGELPLSLVPHAMKLLTADIDLDFEAKTAAMERLVEREHMAERVVEDTIRTAKMEAAMVKIREKAEKLPFDLLETKPPSSMTVKDLGVDLKAHRKEPCHAAVIEPNRWSSKKPELVELCVKPGWHRGANPKSDLVVSGNDEEQARAAENREARRLEKEKREEFEARLGRAAATGTKAKLMDAVAWYVVESSSWSSSAEGACKLLGLEVGKEDRPVSVLRAYAKHEGTYLARAAFAVLASQRNVDVMAPTAAEKIVSIAEEFGTGDVEG